jgi:hypothetical protein
MPQAVRKGRKGKGEMLFGSEGQRPTKGWVDGWEGRHSALHKIKIERIESTQKKVGNRSIFPISTEIRYSSPLLCCAVEFRSLSGMTIVRWSNEAFTIVGIGR